MNENCNLPAKIYHIHTTRGKNHNNRDLHTNLNCPHLKSEHRKVENTLLFDNKQKFPNRSFCSECPNPRDYNRDKDKIKKQKKSMKLNKKLKEIGENGGIENHIKMEQ